VRGRAHDLHVGLEREQGPDAFSHDEVVVGEKHTDGAPWHGPIWPVPGARAKGAPPRSRGGASRCVARVWLWAARCVACSDPAPAPVRQHAPGAVVPRHAVDATPGVRRGGAQVEALDRSAVAEPPWNRPEHQLLVERAGACPEVTAYEVGVLALEVFGGAHGAAHHPGPEARGMILEPLHDDIEEGVF